MSAIPSKSQEELFPYRFPPLKMSSGPSCDEVLSKSNRPKGTKTEWNSEPLKILKKLKVLSGNWTYDFKKDRKNIFYDKILKF